MTVTPEFAEALKGLTRAVDRFAERLSEHGDGPRAAREIGISEYHGFALLQRIRRDLGPQAS